VTGNCAVNPLVAILGIIPPLFAPLRPEFQSNAPKPSRSRDLDDTTDLNDLRSDQANGFESNLWNKDPRTICIREFLQPVV